MDGGTASVLAALIGAIATVTVAVVTTRAKSSTNGTQSELPFVSDADKKAKRPRWPRAVAVFFMMLSYGLAATYLIGSGWLLYSAHVNGSEFLELVAITVGILLPGLLIQWRTMRT